MHPVVIMSYDKGPAITAAVAALEEAGMEVVVLNTKTAKLVQFLGALAGEDDEEDAPADDAPAEDEPPAEDAPAEDEPVEEPSDDLEPLKTEALVNDEKVIVEIVDGKDLVLQPASIEGWRAGTKVTYVLGESQFSFWSNKQEGEALSTNIELTFEGTKKLVSAKLVNEGADKPVLKIGREWLKEAGYPKNSWAVLPASQAVFDKSKVTPDQIDAELNHGSGKGQVMIVQRVSNAFEPKTNIIMMPGQGESMKIGDKSAAHHDQSFAKLGTFHIIGMLKKDGEEWKLDSGDKKIPGLETPEQIKKFKAPVFVFK